MNKNALTRDTHLSTRYPLFQTVIEFFQSLVVVLNLGLGVNGHLELHSLCYPAQRSTSLIPVNTKLAVIMVYTG
jgi:hypothetical protein